MKERIAILGCGRMGRALIGGWIHQGVQPAHILALDPDPAAAQLQASFPGLRVAHPDSVARLDELPTILVVAVKPQAVEVVAPTDYPALTLVTCYPFRYVGRAPMRYVVRAREVERPDPYLARS